MLQRSQLVNKQLPSSLATVFNHSVIGITTTKKFHRKLFSFEFVNVKMVGSAASNSSGQRLLVNSMSSKNIKPDAQYTDSLWVVVVVKFSYCFKFSNQIPFIHTKLLHLLQKHVI